MPFRTRAPGRLPRLLATALFGACGAFTLFGPSVAHADNSIAESTPADGDEVATSPTEIVTTFDNPIGAGSFASIACDGDPYNGLGSAPASNGNRTVTLQLTAPMAGECVVTWTLTDSDGNDESDHPVLRFTVAPGASTAATATEGTTADGGTVAPASEVAADSGSSSGSDDIADASGVSSGPVWLGRVLSIIGLSVLFGSLVLIVAAWPEGPEYVLALRFLRSAWIVGLVGTFIYVIALSAAVQGKSFGSGISPGAWIDLFDAGWGGRAAVLRLVLAVACGWVVLKPERVIDPTTNMVALGIPALAVVTLGLSRTGGSLAFLGVIASIVHVLAMAVWLGAVVLLARVVLAGPGEEDLVHAVKGFGRISNPAIIATVISGLVQVYRQVSASDLFSTGHGRVFLLKTVAVAAMLFVGMTARQIATAKLTRASELSIKSADRLRRAFGTEAAIGLVVVALTGWLLALSPGKVTDDSGNFSTSDDLTLDAPSFEMSVSVSPGRVGMNQLRVIVREPETGLSNFVLRFSPPDGSTGGVAFEQPITLTSRGLAESGEGGGIPFNVPGVWQVQVSGTTGEGEIPASVMFLEIADENGDVPVGDADLPAPIDTPTTTAAPTTAATTAVATTEG